MGLSKLAANVGVAVDSDEFQPLLTRATQSGAQGALILYFGVSSSR
jgi:hypothetical protein